MNNFQFFLAVLLSLSFFGNAQEKVIDTVQIFDNQLHNSRKVQKISTLKSEDLLKNSTNVSDVLRFQSPVYVKENGRGMVSSPSFRGTSAQQTAFIWNGINVNSTFLGQGDINNLSLLSYDRLDVKSGGGSVIYGSSAIGGTIHLNNELSFNRGFQSSFFLEYGSFETFNTFLKSSFSNEKLSIKLSGNLVESDNNYEVPEKNYGIKNWQYDNRTFNIGFSYKINHNNTISQQTQIYDGLQHFPTSDFGTKTEYLTDNFRSLLSWDFRSEKIKNILRLAYWEEEFKYFENIDYPKFNGALGKNYIAKNDFNYTFNKQFAINFIAEYQLNKAEGYNSGIKNVKRNTGSFAGLLRWNSSEKLYFETGAKKDFVENIESPFVYSFSANFNPNNWYSIIFNASKNFRFPSFNDLYWEPGGNLNLKSEISYQAELGNNFKYKDFKLNFTPYYIYIKDMIRWLPTSAGFWFPVNTHKVESFGVESQLDFQKHFGKNELKLSLGYIFTRSKDLETKKSLSYVPKHKIFGSAFYSYDFAELFIQGLFNGLTYTTTDEKFSDAIKPYFVMNTGANFRVLKNFKLGIKVNNIFNKIYETTAFYLMPKRNYNVNVLINF